MEARKVLIYLSIIHNGDWQMIYDDIRDKKIPASSDETEKVVDELKAKTLTIIDPEYPDYLKQVYRPPFVLYYYGDLSLISDYQRCIGVIGSRECSDYGRTMTERITDGLALSHIIVSGLARGIDSIAHKQAITSGGKTVAILGSGIDLCYPPSSKTLYKSIKEDHLLISEYPGKCEAKSNHFPLRNRLIAAMCKCLVVTEAKSRSGTSITVSYALEMGRQVCCVPQNALAGSLCNRLIADGASLVETYKDVLNEINYIEQE